MTVFAQSADMSYFESEYHRPGATFVERLEVLEVIREAGITGIGDFYHDALKVLIQRFPDVTTNVERRAAEACARIICQGLAAEKHNAAAADLWQTVLYFDVIRDHHEGLVMQDALNALGQVDGRDFIPHIVLRLNDFNTQSLADVETRRRVQRAVVGCINALEAFRDPSGFRPVFFVSIGSYDTAIQNMASVALPNIMDDPGEIIAEIIRDPSTTPPIKYEAWREMLRTRAPDASKASVAAVALATGWFYSTPNPAFQRNLREMRISAIDTIRVMGVANDSVYADLERSYSNNFINPVPDFEEIRRTLACLSALRSDQATELMLKFLRELHGRRRVGTWGNRERQVFSWILPNIGASKTQSQDMRLLLMTIQRSNDYTGAEQGWARDALRALSN